MRGTLGGRIGYCWFFLVMRISWLWPDWSPLMRLRGWLVKPCFRKCGKDFQLASTAMILHADRIEVGDHVYLAHNTWVQGVAGVVLEDEVMLGPQTVVVTSNHGMKDGSYRWAHGEMAPVQIGRGSWTGAGCKVLPGVVIGKGALCAAGSVVTTSVPDYTIAAGVPARTVARVDPTSGEKRRPTGEGPADRQGKQHAHLDPQTQ